MIWSSQTFSFNSKNNIDPFTRLTTSLKNMRFFCWQVYMYLYFLFSSPEPKAHRWAYSILMLRRLSVQFQTSFSQKPQPIKAKFYMEPPWIGGTKVWLQHLGHMTNIAATPIYTLPPSSNWSLFKLIFSDQEQIKLKELFAYICAFFSGKTSVLFRNSCLSLHRFWVKNAKCGTLFWRKNGFVCSFYRFEEQTITNWSSRLEKKQKHLKFCFG